MIHFIKLSFLMEGQKTEILELTAACRAKEPVSLSFPLEVENFAGSPDSYYLAYDGTLLVGALALSMPDESLCECIALIRPEYRRRGLFAFMAQEAEKSLEIFPEMEMIAAADSESRDARKALAALDWDLWYTEYMMEKVLSEPIGKVTPPYGALYLDMERTGREEEEILRFHCMLAGESIGSCNISVRGQDSYLFSMEIEEKYRRQGCGSWFLAALTEILRERKVLSVKLQVSGLNEAAVRLYRRLGFQEIQAIDYYIW